MHIILPTASFYINIIILWKQSCALTILGDPGADNGGEGKSKWAEKYGTKKSKEQREEPLGTMSYQTSFKRSPPFWLLIGARKLLCVFLPNQKAERQRPFGTGLVRHGPQGLFSPFFTFLRAIFFHPFRLSLAPTICPWVFEDDVKLVETSFCKAKTVSFWENTPTRPRLPGLVPGIVIPDMAHTLMCRWTGYGFCPFVLNRVYDLKWVCPNYKQGIASTVDFICLMKFVSTPSTQKQWL